MPDGAWSLNHALLLVDRGEHRAAEALIRPGLSANRAASASAIRRLRPTSSCSASRSKVRANAGGLYRRDLGVERALQSGDHLGLACDLQVRRALPLPKGLRRARPLLARAEAVRARFLHASHPEFAATWAQQGRLALASDDRVRANECLAQALAAEAVAALRGNSFPQC